MTPQEFKAWFEGFTEAFTGVPTKSQWTRVKERVAEIDGKPVTERHYIDRYWPTYTPSYTPYYPNPWIRYGINTIGTTARGPMAGQNIDTTSTKYQQTLGMFDSTSAMNALGRADYQALVK